MPDLTKKRGKRPQHTDAARIVDGRNFFDAQQAAAFLGISLQMLYRQTRNKNLTPAALNGREGLVYTRRDLERFKRRKVDRERHIVDALRQGLGPVDAYYFAHERDPSVTLKQVIDVTHAYAEIAGLWIMEGPPGSYARWLERMGLVSLKPKHLRRIIEALLLDPHCGELARLRLDELRSRGELSLRSDATPPARQD